MLGTSLYKLFIIKYQTHSQLNYLFSVERNPIQGAGMTQGSLGRFGCFDMDITKELTLRGISMSLMKWTPQDYGTNVDVCDKQHQELFNRVNALNDAVGEGDRSEVGERLDNLISFVVEHFKTEERLMEQRGFVGLEDHRKEHDNLVTTCVDLQGKFHANEAEIEEGTMSFIKDWLDHHIPVIDRSYGPTLNN
jgi:hemerythrin